MDWLWVVAFVPALVAMAAVGAGAVRWRRWLAGLTGVAAGVSLVVTIIWTFGVPPGSDALGMAEGVALMGLAGLVVRYAPARHAAFAAPAAGLAAATWVLRFFTPASPLEGVGVCAFWGLGALLAAAVGGYLRYLDVRAVRATADARTGLRLRLAGDLHDFVAHDISEMVAHAQAGLVVGDPRAALERVEAAGQRALSMLDRTLDMLHQDRPLAPAGDLNGIRAAAERFSDAGAARVRLRMDPDLTVPPEIGALAYRIVIEGLTNVRRHAPGATRVDLVIAAEAGTLRIAMTNDVAIAGQSARAGDGMADAGMVGGGVTREGGGSGVAGLVVLVRAQGGELVAEAVPDGWSLTANLPLAQSPEWPSASSSPTTRKASEAPSG